MENNVPSAEQIEVLRVACDDARRVLRDATQGNGDLDTAAKAFATVFNAYQEAKASVAGMKVKRVSAFHILKNVGTIVAAVRD